MKVIAHSPFLHSRDAYDKGESILIGRITLMLISKMCTVCPAVPGTLEHSLFVPKPLKIVEFLVPNWNSSRNKRPQITDSADTKVFTLAQIVFLRAARV